MDIKQIQRNLTHFNSEFTNAYLYTDKLDSLIDFKAKRSSIDQLLEYRKAFPQTSRKILKDVLIKQYSDSGIELGGKLEENIKSLESENTFTITTGQQIHVGLGPLYVWYKILNAIAIAEQLNAECDDARFVPVFWMATEDHDLEEIQDIEIYGKTYKWDTDQKGAVGRMSTKGIRTLIDQIEEELNLSEAQKLFLSRAKEVYDGRSLSEATRILVHEQFGDLGLIILDADNQQLKELFTGVVSSELRSEHKTAFEHSTQTLEDKGFEAQIYIRDINLFYLENGRERIVEDGAQLKAGDKVLCSSDSLDQFIDEQIVNISPNVALRPVYQEVILPNLVYVGGPSEVKYWLQLRDVFHLHHLKMPMLYLRNSWVILSEKALKKLEISSLEEMYHDSSDLMKEYADHVQKLKDEALSELSEVRKSLKIFGDRVENSIPGFSLSGKINKIYPKLQELQELSEGKFAELGQNNPAFNKIVKAQSVYFSQSAPQERTKHILEFVGVLSELKQNRTFNNLDNLLEINHLVTKTI